MERRKTEKLRKIITPSVFLLASKNFSKKVELTNISKVVVFPVLLTTIYSVI